MRTAYVLEREICVQLWQFQRVRCCSVLGPDLKLGMAWHSAVYAFEDFLMTYIQKTENLQKLSF